MKWPKFTDFESLGFRDIVFGKLHDEVMEYIYSLPSVDTAFCKRSEALPLEPGVYFVAMADEIIYIGKTVDLWSRWQQQHKLRNLWGEIKIFYQVYKTDIEPNLMDVDEATFISILRPIHNQVIGKVNLNCIKRIHFLDGLLYDD